MTNTSSERNIEDLGKLLNMFNFEDKTCSTKKEELKPNIKLEVVAQPIVKISRDPETNQKTISVVTESELGDTVFLPVSTGSFTQHASPGIPSLRPFILLTPPLPSVKKSNRL